MATFYEYNVMIQSCDYDPEYGCVGERYRLKEETFDTYEEACEFVRNITPEQALEWERATKCNGLDILIIRDELLGDKYCAHYEGFEILGYCEWIGDKLNLLEL